MNGIFIHLKRLITIPTATKDHEGQVRYVRTTTKTGHVYAARYQAVGTTYEWVPVTILVKAGAPADTDYESTPPDGAQAIDTTNSRFYVRVGGTWKYAALT